MKIHVAVFQSSFGTALFLADRTHRHLRSNISRTAHWISMKFEMPSDSINGMKCYLPGTSIIDEHNIFDYIWVLRNTNILEENKFFGSFCVVFAYFL